MPAALCSQSLYLNSFFKPFVVLFISDWKIWEVGKFRAGFFGMVLGDLPIYHQLSSQDSAPPPTTSSPQSVSSSTPVERRAYSIQEDLLLVLSLSSFDLQYDTRAQEDMLLSSPTLLKIT
ncbi:hypothetical protein ONZ45_g15729 [Pleurotus djamor]|nr:hypothetical protein ONZ45_g15729 [Pleurotus djamor]